MQVWLKITRFSRTSNHKRWNYTITRKGSSNATLFPTYSTSNITDIRGNGQLLSPLKTSSRTPLFQAVAGKMQILSVMETAFVETKALLANATLLIHPHPDVLTSIATDAYDTAIDAVLQQFVNGVWVPLAFFSQRLRPSEMKYSTFDRELLAVYLSIRHFRYFIEGRILTVFTYHRYPSCERSRQPGR